ncbi:Ankyrin repeat family protein [Quillaja saponaria]|uniref:Ankyrin repeat family protein n=1 Tax=Quillaja saponaria TaxID=32244 RepID=A0AAD7Q4Y0_QUISA|nr:Ankyrin repeat family protein [Quillaja saponaria]
MSEALVSDAIFQAAERGISEFIIESSKAYPDLLWDRNKNGGNLFFSAIEFRQAKVFSLIYGLAIKDGLASALDLRKNKMLHVAGLAPKTELNRISGAALQMQRELQWFKEVESILPPYMQEALNIDKKTPRDVFTENHKELVKDGEIWMKGTASSCTVVGALIVTIMFAAAFTVPGGNHEDTGYPVFLNRKLFMLFMISDAISLFSSSTSVLMFLGILTSRYAEEDFLKPLPKKLIIGLSTLFLSIATMMMTFCAAMYLTLHGQLWIFIPLILLASIPVTLFILLQFPPFVKAPLRSSIMNTVPSLISWVKFCTACSNIGYECWRSSLEAQCNFDMQKPQILCGKHPSGSKPVTCYLFHSQALNAFQIQGKLIN